MNKEQRILSVQQFQKIGPEDYAKVRPIFAGLAEIQLNVTAVLDGTAPGEVYVHAADGPQTACLTSGDGCYLAGAPINRGFNAALNAFLPRDTYFVLFCDPHLWEDALDDLLRDTYAVRARRRFYALKRLRVPDWRKRIPPGFSMQRIDAEFLSQGLTNGDAVVAAILSEWSSLAGFLEAGFGFCLVHGDEIVSWSFSDYVSRDRCEIGICTLWSYRRRGFGTLTAAAVAAQAVAAGFSSVGWHCWDNNVGSIRVAENVGFERAADYDVFINHWAAENVTDMSRDEFRAFAEFYERQFETRPPSSGFPHIVAAKAWALCGESGGCFRQLTRAADLGWLRDAGHLREIWPEFFSIQNLDQTAEWRDLAKKLKPSVSVP